MRPKFGSVKIDFGKEIFVLWSILPKSVKRMVNELKHEELI